MGFNTVFSGAFLVTVLFMMLIIKTRRAHSALTAGPELSIQKIHVGAVPRIGGLAMIFGFWFAMFMVESNPSKPLILITCINASIIFGIGLVEDLSSSLKVSWRLALSFVPSYLICYQSNFFLTHLGWATADSLLSSTISGINIFGLTFTAFALTGVSHSFNIIDGLNGLVGFASVCILLALIALGHMYDDYLIVQMSFLVIAPLLGFLLFNWPWGRCFLGDGGAYFLGFSIAWIGVLLVERHPAISPFAVLLICGYPVTETLYSIARRIKDRKSPGSPDMGHMHQLFSIKLIQPLIAEQKVQFLKEKTISNSLSGLTMNMLITPFIVLGIYFNSDKYILVALCFLELVLYSIFHRHLSAKNYEG